MVFLDQFTLLKYKTARCFYDLNRLPKTVVNFFIRKNHFSYLHRLWPCYLVPSYCRFAVYLDLRIFNAVKNMM